MADNGENPFRRALDPPADDEAARVRPFKGDADSEVENPVKADQLRTIEDLGLVDEKALARNPKIAKLTVRDLNDLASQFSGIATSNRTVAELTIEDMQDIEGVFLEYKLNTARDLAGRAGDGAELAISVDVSCCCTTPCCCCAAAEVDPVLA